jgi:hypothetical protein
VSGLELGRWDMPELAASRRWLHQSIYSATATSASSISFHGPLFRINSALNKELKATAIALS